MASYHCSGVDGGGRHMESLKSKHCRTYGPAPATGSLGSFSTCGTIIYSFRYSMLYIVHYTITIYNNMLEYVP